MKTYFTLLLYLFVISHLSAQTIPNSDFENWTTVDYPLLSGWTTSNEFFVNIEGDAIKVEPSTVSQSGTFAVSIGTAFMGFAGMPTPGFIVNGTLNAFGNLSAEENILKAGTPLNQKITALNGYYTYENNENDSTTVTVILKRYDFTADTIMQVGYGTAKLRPQADYTPFSVPVQDLMPGVEPDSIVVYFSAFDIEFTGIITEIATLKIDNISLVPLTNTDDENPLQASLYPNPAKDFIVLESVGVQDVQVQIFSVSGQLIRTLDYPILPATCPIDIAELPAGSYLLKVDKNREMLFGKRFIKG